MRGSSHCVALAICTVKVLDVPKLASGELQYVVAKFREMTYGVVGLNPKLISPNKGMCSLLAVARIASIIFIARGKSHRSEITYLKCHISVTYLKCFISEMSHIRDYISEMSMPLCLAWMLM